MLRNSCSVTFMIHRASYLARKIMMGRAVIEVIEDDLSIYSQLGPCVTWDSK